MKDAIANPTLKIYKEMALNNGWELRPSVAGHQSAALVPSDRRVKYHQKTFVFFNVDEACAFLSKQCGHKEFKKAKEAVEGFSLIEE